MRKGRGRPAGRHFGGSPVDSMTYLSAAQLQVSVNNMTAGLYDVTVSNGAGGRAGNCP